MICNNVELGRSSQNQCNRTTIESQFRLKYGADCMFSLVCRLRMCGGGEGEGEGERVGEKYSCVARISVVILIDYYNCLFPGARKP